MGGVEKARPLFSKRIFNDMANSWLPLLLIDLLTEKS